MAPKQHQLDEATYASLMDTFVRDADLGDTDTPPADLPDLAPLGDETVAHVYVKPEPA